MDYVLNLKAHAFRLTDWPDDAADYDRKIRGQQGVVKVVTFKQDATDYVHWFIMTEFLVKGLRNTELLKCLKPVILLPHVSP